MHRLSKFISPHKDNDERMEKNDVVYKISCKNCKSSYVGQTKRKLCTRIREHIYNIHLDPSRHSVVSEHIKDLNHEFDWHNIQILDVEHNYQKRLISEMIHIKSQECNINAQKNTECLDDAYTCIIKELAVLPSSNNLRGGK